MHKVFAANNGGHGDNSEGFLVQRRGALLFGLTLPSAHLSEPVQAASDDVAYATFAGGCFWCMEPPFDKLEGVISTTSGYSGGKEPYPDYRTVSDGKTGHAESMQVKYDPSVISFEELLDVFWHQINPTQKNQQFCDRGRQYRSIIFYSTPAEKAAAIASKDRYQEMGIFGGEIVTEITPSSKFWPAESYHQDFYIKNYATYKYYRMACGRDAYLNDIWAKENSING